MPQNGLTRVSDTAGENLARPGSLPSETSRRWLWYGFGQALVWLWCGLEVALGWLCAPEYMPSICLLYGFAVALGGLSAQGSGFKVQGSMWEQSASRASTPSRSARGSETRPVCSVRAAIWRRTDAFVLAVNAGLMNEAHHCRRANYVQY